MSERAICNLASNDDYSLKILNNSLESYKYLLILLPFGYNTDSPKYILAY